MELSNPVLLAMLEVARLRARRSQDQEDHRLTARPERPRALACSPGSPAPNAAWLPTDDAVADPMR